MNCHPANGCTGVHASIVPQQSWDWARCCCHMTVLTGNKTEWWFSYNFHLLISKIRLCSPCGHILYWRLGFRPIFTGFTKICSTVSAAAWKSFMCRSLLSRDQECQSEHTNFCTLGKNCQSHHTELIFFILFTF